MKRLVIALLLFTSPVWATTAKDDFKRANGPLGTNWKVIDANAAPIISSNAFTNGSGSSDNNVGNPGGNAGSAFWLANPFGANQFAQITIPTVGATGTDCIPGPGVRMSSTGGGNGYFILAGPNTTGTHPNYTIEVWKDVGGTYAPLGQAGFSPTIVAGDKLWISAIGNRISAYYFNSATPAWVQIFNATDSSLSTGQPGITVFLGTPAIDHPAATTFGNAWSAGDFSNTSLQLASDTFTEGGTLDDQIAYANGALHTRNANWVYVQGTFQVSSNGIYGSAAGIDLTYRSDLTPNNDQWAQTTAVVTGNAATQSSGPCVRVSTVAVTAYCAQYANNTCTIFREIAGTLTVIASCSGGTAIVGTGTIVTLRVIGTTLTLYVNNFLEATVTDTNIASGRIGYFSVANTATNGATRWAGGNFSIPANFSTSATGQQYVSDPTNGAWALLVDVTAANPATGCATTNCVSLLWENTIGWPVDQWSQGVLTPASAPSTTPFVGGSFGVGVRLSNNADTGYSCNAFNDGADEISITSEVAGTGTTLVKLARTYVAGQTYRLEVQGNTLSCKVNGTLILTVPDSTIASGKAGIFNFHPGAATIKTISTWAAGGFAGGSAVAGPVKIAGPATVN